MSADEFAAPSRSRSRFRRHWFHSLVGLAFVLIGLVGGHVEFHANGVGLTIVGLVLLALVLVRR